MHTRMKTRSAILAVSAALTLSALAVPAGASDSLHTTLPLSISVPATAGQAVDVWFDGALVCPGQTLLMATSTYLPLRAFCRGLGIEDVTWDEASATATVNADGLTIKATAGATWLEANGRAFHAPDGIRVVDGVMMVPIRPLARAFGLEVYWDEASYSATLVGSGTAYAASASAVYSENDLYWLSRIIAAESCGEPLTGQLAVGNVVLNRVASSEFPDTIYDVIFDTRYAIQFTPVANGTIYNEPDAASVTAAKLALEGYTVSTAILYFLNPDLSTSFWIPQNRPYQFTVGTHDFYA